MLTFASTIQNRYVGLKFSDKPSERIRSILKANGYRWSPSAGLWSKTTVSGAADFIAALRTAIDREAGVRRPDGACWDCQNAEGYFRSYGARTPVYCDACQEKHQALERGEQRALDVDRMYEDDCASRCGL